MAKLVLNPGIQQIRGQIGGFVYRTHGDEQTLAKAPDMSRVKWSPAQVQHRQRFRAAVAHARAVLADPELRSHYEREAAQRGKRPFDLAVSDYFRFSRHCEEGVLSGASVRRA